MFKKYIVILLIFVLQSFLWGALLEVGQTDDFVFNTIQSAVDYAVENDTILVHPGHYIENVRVIEKSLVIGSLFMSTNDTTYIENTIVDGNNSGTVFYVYHERYFPELRTITLSGFSIINGNGAMNEADEIKYAGGVFIGSYSTHSSEFSKVSNCIIKNNNGAMGGGGTFFESNILLEGCVIFNNNGGVYGGGFMADGNDYQIVFSQENLNSIYSNSAGNGKDIYFLTGTDESELGTICLDKISINPEDDDISNYYHVDSRFDWNEDLTYNTIANERYEADLYVSMVGSDNNSGLNSSDPLKTISKACSLLKPRADGEYNTIYVAPGLYTPTLTGEILPISINQGTRIVGEDPNITVIDGENSITNFFFIENRGNISVEGLTLTNLFSGTPFSGTIFAKYSNNLIFKNLIINDVHSYLAGLYFNEVDGFIVSDIYLNNYNYRGFGFLKSNGLSNNLWADNLNVTYILPGVGASSPFHYEIGDYEISNIKVTNSVIPGGRAFQYVNPSEDANDDVTINNLLVANCSTSPLDWNMALIGFGCEHNQNIYVNNLTVVNNTSSLSSVYMRGNVVMRNVILDNDTLNEIKIGTASEPPYNPGTSILDIDNSLIRGGIDAIYVESNDYNNLIWGENNIDVAPSFVGGNEEDYNSYQLAEGSPCIDAGTPDLDEYYITEYDMLGHARLFGSAVDIGCFEFGAPVSNADNEESEKPHIEITLYPNPFNPETTIDFNLKEDSNVELSIYNIKGQLVKKLVSEKLLSGNHKIVWKGENSSNKRVSSGIYFCKLKTAYKTTTRKMVLIK
ncbi:MAG: hypothetical protein B6226_00155 [Candidatus Cloacimonetes bacterium 4572_65]|nr:MAG: hypothetical protein B6226_00155 [Candidatus Cloacimonetes bacterium 4572_65]